MKSSLIVLRIIEELVLNERWAMEQVFVRFVTFRQPIVSYMFKQVSLCHTQTWP